MGLMLGRCPDCHMVLTGQNPEELVGDILGHQCLEHSPVDAE